MWFNNYPLKEAALVLLPDTSSVIDEVHVAIGSQE